MHDDLIAVQHLLAVDTRVLPQLVGALGYDQAPSDQRHHIAGPAVLDGQAGKIDTIALPHHRLTRSREQILGHRVPQRLGMAADVFKQDGWATSVQKRTLVKHKWTRS